MSIVRPGFCRLGGATLLSLVCLSSVARAEEKIPFYDKDPETSAEKKDTALSGSITSSSFYFRETGGIGTPVDRTDMVGPRPESASSMDRVFTELRLQLRADHLGGGDIDFKADLRARANPSVCQKRTFMIGTELKIYDCLKVQSGTFGGNELDARELWVKSRGKSYDFTLGRQFMTEVVGYKFDGLRVDQHKKGSKWRFFGYGGLYPLRGSRDVRADYPVLAGDPNDPNAQEQRLMPVVGGAGGSFRGERAYGSLAANVLLPLANDAATTQAETNRIFLSSTGYWAQSPKTDIYHLIVLDVAGARGAGITNLSLGVNHRPTNGVTAFASVDRVDTETLNVHAQLRLDQQDLEPAGAALIQNNVGVSRVAQEAARAGLSAAFSQNRFELSASGTLRRRPEISLFQNDGTPVLLPTAQAADINVQLVDRRSYKDFRFAGNLTRSFGVGKENLDRAVSTVGRLSASRDLPDGKGEYELHANYVKATDQDLTQNCNAGQLDIFECFGTADATTIGLGGLVFYRPDVNWYLMGSASIATQTLVTADIDGTGVAQPAILMLTAFLRGAYRF